MNGKEGADSIYLPAGLAAAAATADLPKADVDDTQEIALETDTVTSSSTSSSKTSHLFLKQAVERGDWQAVGQAAAIMGKDSKDINGSAHETLYLEKEDRIEQLDELIAEGDWIGVLTLAGQYEAMDRDLAIDAETNTDLGDHEEDTAFSANVSESVRSNENDSEASAPPLLLRQAIQKGDWQAGEKVSDAPNHKSSPTHRSYPTNGTSPPAAAVAEAGADRDSNSPQACRVDA